MARTHFPRFVLYQGQGLGLSLTFRYPEDWRLQEEEGAIDLYRQVRLLGPRNREDTYTPYLSVAAAPVKAEGGRFEDLTERIGLYRANLPVGAKLEQEGERVVGGERGLDLTIRYVIPPLHHKGLKNLPIPVKTRTLFFQRDRTLYEVIYSADAREYDLYAKVFEELLKSLHFQS